MKIAIIESAILNIIDRITIKRLATGENIVIQAGNNNTVIIKAELCRDFSWDKPPY